jgi:SpoVK/Ycf46/Vps4 family AAA+-type ATPase
VVAPDAINVTFADVGGLQAIGEQLQRNIILPFSRPELFAQSKLLRPPKGILLHGPPGTGKTLLARAVAREARFTFICLNPARLLSKWYGESNKFAESYFSLANKLAPSILFIDEIDCLFRTRARAGAGTEHEATSMLKAQFLSLWDGLLSPSAPQARAPRRAPPAAPCRFTRPARAPLPAPPPTSLSAPLSPPSATLPYTAAPPHGAASPVRASGGAASAHPPLLARACVAAVQIVVIAATNSPDDVDPAVLRRLPLSFEVPLPGIDGRADVLRLLLRDEPLASEIDVHELACATDGYSGSDLDQLCKTAAMRALEDALEEEQRERPNAAPGAAPRQPAGAPTARTAAARAYGAARAPAGSSSAGASSPPILLRKLTLDDFLGARAVVRPTRGRFTGVHHDVHSAAPPPPANLDDDLYN